MTIATDCPALPGNQARFVAGIGDGTRLVFQSVFTFEDFEMLVCVERTNIVRTGWNPHGFEPSSVWLLSGTYRGWSFRFRVRGGDNWNRKAASNALDVLGVELPEVSRRSIRFLVK